MPESSIKLDRVKELLEENIIPNGNKAVIFSSWEQETAIVKDALSEYNPAYIIGAKTPEERMAEVNRFQNDPDFDFLPTTEVGGFQFSIAELVC